MKILCYVNHYFGPSAGFEGRSTDQGVQRRREIVATCLRALRELPGAEVRVCGVEGRSLEPLDIRFPQVRETPRLLVYESLEHMARRVDDGYDYFINIEDDILLPSATFSNSVAFDADSLLNEVLLPNRIEYDDAGEQFWVDWDALLGWTNQRRRHRGREIRVALNPHAGLLILSREKLEYALRHLDGGFRGRIVGAEMASAYAYYHSPFCLYRPYGDLTFHTVTHLDGGMVQWARWHRTWGPWGRQRATRQRRLL